MTRRQCEAKSLAFYGADGRVHHDAPEEIRPRCRNPATIQYEGKWWCYRHAPGQDARSDFRRAIDFAEDIEARRVRSTLRVKILAEQFLDLVHGAAKASGESGK